MGEFLGVVLYILCGLVMAKKIDVNIDNETAAFIFTIIGWPILLVFIFFWKLINFIT